ncbi:acetyl-CoA acetyltransferase [Ferroglobus placidus DSM 10642]|uniref:Acetyl-CoA acetyltransferase n=1 Tax=Ferroglobus placidus (strain DSM 10642 / AEDII12DO) TaxID=589924 RepID=D3RXF3_FERPA|nr:acetyl-CoA C-acetyltransferase [Ferroglobus placidus]ADC65166.1 acetyl-CoA acetyltransferase [Ferroglobus placidus DSM 10642]
MVRSVIVSGVRTPIGKFGGSLRDVPAVELGALVIKEAVKRAGIKPEDVDEVIMGQVVTAGCGQNTARQAAIKAGIPVEVPAFQLNKVCTSGLKAIALAHMMIQTGEAEVVVAGGMESMSSAPYGLLKARWGYRMFNDVLVDLMVHDGLWDPIYNQHMAENTEDVADEFGVSRDEMDEWAYYSHVKAIKAIDEGKFAEEIVPVVVKEKKGERVVDTDECPRRDTSLEKIKSLPPVFRKDGKITAGNAPNTSDGAAAVVVMSEDKAKELGVEPKLEIVSYGQASQDPKYIATVPAYAAEKALKKAELNKDDIDLWEINEAFAAVTLISGKYLLNLDMDRVNVNGGAVALGHPIGATGARLVVTLMHEMLRRKSEYGVVTLCAGMAQGDAMVFRLY